MTFEFWPLLLLTLCRPSVSFLQPSYSINDPYSSYIFLQLIVNPDKKLTQFISKKIRWVVSVFKDDSEFCFQMLIDITVLSFFNVEMFSLAYILAWLNRLIKID